MSYKLMGDSIVVQQVYIDYVLNEDISKLIVVFENTSKIQVIKPAIRLANINVKRNNPR